MTCMVNHLTVSDLMHAQLNINKPAKHKSTCATMMELKQVENLAVTWCGKTTFFTILELYLLQFVGISLFTIHLGHIILSFGTWIKLVSVNKMAKFGSCFDIFQLFTETHGLKSVLIERCTSWSSYSDHCSNL